MKAFAVGALGALVALFVGQLTGLLPIYIVVYYYVSGATQ